MWGCCLQPSRDHHSLHLSPPPRSTPITATLRRGRPPLSSPRAYPHICLSPLLCALPLFAAVVVLLSTTLRHHGLLTGATACMLLLVFVALLLIVVVTCSPGPVGRRSVVLLMDDGGARGRPEELGSDGGGARRWCSTPMEAGPVGARGQYGDGDASAAELPACVHERRQLHYNTKLERWRL